MIIPQEFVYQADYRKKRNLAYILWLVGGLLGAHRFFLGFVWTGIIWLLTGGLFGIGWIIDFFRIPYLTKLSILLKNATTPRNGYHVRRFRRFKRYYPNGRVVEDVIETQGMEDISDFIHPENETYYSSTTFSEREILKAAIQLGGIVTPVMIAAKVPVSIEDAEKVLETLVKKGYANYIISQDGVKYYKIIGIEKPSGNYEEI